MITEEIKYVNSPLNYTGSKFNLLEQLLPEFDYSKKYFIDLFCGGGSVYINVLDKYEKILINDIIKELIDIHSNLINCNEEFITRVKTLAPKKDSPEQYGELRTSFNSEKTSEKLFALMLSCTNNMMRFNNKFEFNQTFGKRSFNDKTNEKINLLFNHFKNNKKEIYTKSAHFSEIVPKKETMIYIDPPYGYIKDENDNILNKQISEAGYNCYWKQSDDIKLYEYIKHIHQLGHSFVLSSVYKHNNKTSWLIHKLIKDGFKYKEMDFDYKKVSRIKDEKNTIEVIIKNF